MRPRVLIIMGSDSDLPVMEETERVFKELGIAYSITVASAHRTPERATELASKAEEKGYEVIIACAGMSAHLAGVLASHTILPVIGVPIAASPLDGLDSLLSTVQMPPGVPVATMAVGKAGAKNAALFAAQIMGLRNVEVRKKLKEYRKKVAAEVERKARAIEKRAQT